MPPTPSALSRARTTLATRLATLVILTVTAFAGFASVTPGSHAHAGQMSARERFAMKADEVLHVASNQQGDPYRYGAAGPNAFDCSGLVYYTFRKALGRTLPRVANDQKRASKRIWHPRRNLRPGDLVFHVDGNYAYHVGIYAGHGTYWHAPHTGSHVQKDPVSYGRGWRFGRIIHS